MKKLLITLGCSLTIGLTSVPAAAVYNATVQGTITWIDQVGLSVGYAAETVRFVLDNQPNINCGGWNNFVISPTSIADAQSRKNMFAILLAAKATGAPVLVAYDSNGTGCDQGMPVVYYLRML
jgi:hypothetical protein